MMMHRSTRIAAEVDKEMKEKMKQLEEAKRSKIPAVIKGGKEVYPIRKSNRVS